jgi:hypothetical protein
MFIPPPYRRFIRIMGRLLEIECAMASFRKSPAYFLIASAVLIVLTGLAEATTTNLTVQRDEETTHLINLAVEDRVAIRFTVVGATASTVHFSITFPNATIRDFGEVGEFSYSFICDAEGQYTLGFVNNDLTENKLVTLNYEVDHYIFGVPQMLFLTIIIMLACIGGVVAYVLLGKT